jgi:hypothetical protein
MHQERLWRGPGNVLPERRSVAGGVTEAETEAESGIGIETEWVVTGIGIGVRGTGAKRGIGKGNGPGIGAETGTEAENGRCRGAENTMTGTGSGDMGVRGALAGRGRLIGVTIGQTEAAGGQVMMGAGVRRRTGDGPVKVIERVIEMAARTMDKWNSAGEKTAGSARLGGKSGSNQEPGETSDACLIAEQ